MSWSFGITKLCVNKNGVMDDGINGPRNDDLDIHGTVFGYPTGIQTEWRMKGQNYEAMDMPVRGFILYHTYLYLGFMRRMYWCVGSELLGENHPVACTHYHTRAHIHAHTHAHTHMCTRAHIPRRPAGCG